MDQESQFSVGLPGREAASAPQRPCAGVAPEAVPASLRVLVVDDHVDAAATLALLLRLAGHEVRQAHSGPAALQAAQAYQPGVVLLDIGLPGLNGYEVAQRLRAEPQTQNTVLIALTGYHQESAQDRTMETEFDHYLVKPVDPPQLLDLLTRLASRR